jgi:hypothetical protein
LSAEIREVRKDLPSHSLQLFLSSEISYLRGKYTKRNI